MDRFLAALGIAFVAVWFGQALHIPIWRTWEPGDLTDIFLTTFLSVLWLTRKRS